MSTLGLVGLFALFILAAGLALWAYLTGDPEDPPGRHSDLMMGQATRRLYPPGWPRVAEPRPETLEDIQRQTLDGRWQQ